MHSTTPLVQFHTHTFAFVSFFLIASSLRVDSMKNDDNPIKTVVRLMSSTAEIQNYLIAWREKDSFWEITEYIHDNSIV